MESADEDEISAEAESHLSVVCANVMKNVAIQHPIVSFDLNMCELVKKSHTHNFKSGEAKRHVHRPCLNISDISSQKRKTPYIARLTQLIQECNYSSK